MALNGVRSSCEYRRQKLILNAGSLLRCHTGASLGLQHLFAFLIGTLHGLDSFGLGHIPCEFGIADEDDVRRRAEQ